MDLFSSRAQSELQRAAPLADRMRPRTFAEYVGQEQLVGQGSLLRAAIEADTVPSLILWGPPGTGKTTLARIIADGTKSEFVPFSAVTAGTKELKEAIAAAQDRLKFSGKRTILFVDEIHRWNKSQQDALLPHVENGSVTLIGATTENPSFEVNAALLSRCRVHVLQQLEPAHIGALIDRALADRDRGLGKFRAVLEPQARDYLVALSDGDARTALNALEFAVTSAPAGADGSVTIDRPVVEKALAKSLRYDRAGEEHYNIISALHKSMRGGDADAALYWLGRMLEAGEDPLYVARRVIRFASEDVGLADPQALVQTVAAFDACRYLGMPECAVHLAQAVAYCARAPKSNALYTAYGAVQAAIRERPNEPVPLHIRNAPTKLMRNLGYGAGYKYTPDYEDPKDARQDYLPESLRGTSFLGE